MAVLSCPDYVVIGVMLLISLTIGIYYRFTGGRQRTIEEYFNANRSMSIIPVAIALMVSFMSAISLLGGSAESYFHGTQFVTINLSHLLGYPIICYGFFPVFDKLQVKSVYEYLEKRFGKGARMTTSFLYWIQLLLYSGVVLYAPSLALEATTGLSKNGVIVIIGLICTFYSSIGGIKAVLITDVFQAFLMFVSLFAIIGTSAANSGGLLEIWKIAKQGQRIEFDSISLDPTVRHTWWSLMIGGFFICLSLYGVNQVQIQRMLTVRDLKSARKALWLSWPILMCLSCLISFTGLAIFSKYHNCDPLTEKKINSTDQLMPWYVMDTMSGVPGLCGLFIAGIFSAGLSTISAGLNSLAAITLEDFVKPIYSKCSGANLSAKKSLLLGKILTSIYGILCIGVAFLAQFLGGVLEASLIIFGLVGGPLVGIFTLGMGTESATEVGAISGVMTSIVLLLWAGFGQPRPKPSSLPVSINGCGYSSFLNMSINTSNQTIVPTSNIQVPEVTSYFYLYRISYMWYSPIGFFITFSIGLLVSYFMSFFVKRKNVEIDSNLFFPIIQRRIMSKRNEKGVNRESLQHKYVFSENQSYEMNDGVGTATHL